MPEATHSAPTPAANQTPFSPASELRAAWRRHLEGRCRVTPWQSTRASGIGDQCERRVFYYRTEGQRARPPSPDLQAIFDLGRHLEVYGVRKLEEMGFEVVQRGKDWQHPELELTGHVDALIRREGWPFDVPTEIKGLNPYTAGTIERIADIRDHDSPWVRKYYDQLQVYLHFEDKPLGLFWILDKSGGGFVPIDCPRDYQRFALLQAKALRIREAVRNREPPPRNVLEGECDRCPFLHVCGPDRVFGPGLRVMENPPFEVLAMLDRRAQIQAQAQEYARIDKRLKAILPEGPEIVVGDWLIEGEEHQRVAYSVPAGSYWTRDFKRLGRSGGEQ